ncbi:hypothetical protein HIM_06122 [Hirsutella minnesotensis 3608]|uniref:Uncharacterized protein n=1 Tax=Hirsutella minnesotensis 3608 TaxID=1043627 RepID=A0A0F7ZJL8_9HYPO|nr:hypothetical protein HIM_06122 [Hirsutella minnesotensis 3608]
MGWVGNPMMCGDSSCCDLAFKRSLLGPNSEMMLRNLSDDSIGANLNLVHRELTGHGPCLSPSRRCNDRSDTDYMYVIVRLTGAPHFACLRFCLPWHLGLFPRQSATQATYGVKPADLVYKTVSGASGKAENWELGGGLDEDGWASLRLDAVSSSSLRLSRLFMAYLLRALQSTSHMQGVLRPLPSRGERSRRHGSPRRLLRELPPRRVPGTASNEAHARSTSHARPRMQSPKPEPPPTEKSANPIPDRMPCSASAAPFARPATVPRGRSSGTRRRSRDSGG